jgi:hypothetical protein
MRVSFGTVRDVLTNAFIVLVPGRVAYKVSRANNKLTTPCVPNLLYDILTSFYYVPRYSVYLSVYKKSYT